MFQATSCFLVDRRARTTERRSASSRAFAAAARKASTSLRASVLAKSLLEDSNEDRKLLLLVRDECT